MLFIFFVLNSFALVWTFYVLCLLCDEHLVPAVDIFIKQFEVPEEVAAVTLIAFGSAAPELFLNSVSAVIKTSDLSLSAILGSGMIAFGLIPPLCILNARKFEMKFKIIPIIRECSFYLIGLLVFLVNIKDGILGTSEALVTISIYLVYVLLVIISYWRDLRARTLNNLMGKHPHLAHIIAANPSITEADIQALNVRHARGEWVLVPPDQHPLLKDGKENEEWEDEELGGGDYVIDGVDVVEDIEKIANPMHRSTITSRCLEGMNALFTTPIRFLLNKIFPSLDGHPQPQPLSEQTSSTPTPWSSRASSQRPTVRSKSSSISSRGSSPSLTDPSGGIEGEERLVYSPLALSPSSRSSNSSLSMSESDKGVVEGLVPLWTVSTVLGMSIVGISICASLIVFLSETLVSSLGIGSSTMGATIVALGAEIPDTISAMALARNGYHDGAIAGAIGSQVINISLGVGLPALFVCLTGGGYLRIEHGQASSLWLLTCLLVVVIVSYISVTLPISRMWSERRLLHSTVVTKASATVQLCVWGLVYFTFIYLNEG